MISTSTIIKDRFHHTVALIPACISLVSRKACLCKQKYIMAQYANSRHSNMTLIYESIYFPTVEITLDTYIIAGYILRIIKLQWNVHSGLFYCSFAASDIYMARQLCCFSNHEFRTFLIKWALECAMLNSLQYGKQLVMLYNMLAPHCYSSLHCAQCIVRL